MAHGEKTTKKNYFLRARIRADRHGGLFSMRVEVVLGA